MPRLHLAGSLALCLSLGTGPVAAAPAGPSERDLAYELGVQAETAGDDGRAAAAFERAFRLTSPAESGPRLLFLRASVAARLRADDGSAVGRVQLCSAQALLREYLGDTPAPGGQDPLAEERASLAGVEQRLLTGGGPDCATLLGTGPVAPTPAGPQPGEPQPVKAQPVAPTSAASTTGVATSAPVQPAAPTTTLDDRPERRRALRTAGGVSLGVGVAGLSLMIAGISTARRATARGEAACREGSMGCEAALLLDIRADGRRGNTLAWIGAVTGGITVITGAVLLAVGERKRGPRRVTLTPTWTPTWSGAALSGRF